MLVLKSCDIVEPVAQRVCGIFIPAAFLNLVSRVAEQPHITGYIFQPKLFYDYICK